MNYSEEDYIKEIYELNIKIYNKFDEFDYISVSKLAESLQHTNQSTNEMVKKLAKKGCLIYTPYKGVKLTEKGFLEAKRLLRIHRLWEVFLVEKLGFSWEKVDAEAHLLEHATSEVLERKLYEFLDRPERCPHGGIIPGFDDKVPTKSRVRLIDGEVGCRYRLSSVIDHHELLVYLNENKIALYSKIEIIMIDDLNDNIVVMINDRKITMGKNIASKMFISSL